MKTMRAKPVADGHEAMTSANVVSKVLASPRAKSTPRSVAAPFLKNTGIPTSFTRIETSAKRTLREQFIAEQESSANLIEQVDELKRKKEKTERGFEEFKIQQQKEYNQLREDIMCFSSFSGKSQSSTLLA
jgi:hypothetical protein